MLSKRSTRTTAFICEPNTNLTGSQPAGRGEKIEAFATDVLADLREVMLEERNLFARETCHFLLLLRYRRLNTYRRISVDRTEERLIGEARSVRVIERIGHDRMSRKGEMLLSFISVLIEFRSFPDGRHFDQKSFAPIEENTVLLLDTRTGQLINQWGNHT